MWYSNIKIGVTNKLVTNASAATKNQAEKAKAVLRDYAREAIMWYSNNKIGVATKLVTYASAASKN